MRKRLKINFLYRDNQRPVSLIPRQEKFVTKGLNGLVFCWNPHPFFPATILCLKTRDDVFRMTWSKRVALQIVRHKKLFVGLSRNIIPFKSFVTGCRCKQGLYLGRKPSFRRKDTQKLENLGNLKGNLIQTKERFVKTTLVRETDEKKNIHETLLQ